MSIRPETPIPRTNILEIVPELAGLATITVRLHPRRGEVAELLGSKLGGTFLWPKSEPWPTCDEVGPPEWSVATELPADAPQPALVPVLQLRAADAPELPFPRGTDLFQLLWCPTDHTANFVAKPFVFWRDSRDLVDSPVSISATTAPDGNYVPTPCALHLERVREFPHILDLDETLKEKLKAWRLPNDMAGFFGGPTTMYEWALSVCPSNKIGGNVFWGMDDETPNCDACGTKLRHLLSLTDSEYDGGTFPRWMPTAERPLWDGDFHERMAVQNAPDWNLGGRLIVFTCTACEHRPIRSVFQR